MLIIRLVRATFVFAIIFLSYLFQIFLVRVFGRRESPKHGVVAPEWLKTRRINVDQRNAKRLLRAMLRLRGVYIKLGQVLSIMGGFLPRVYAKELEQLQDQVPPKSFSTIERTILQNFGKPTTAIFRQIDHVPIAAASLGQVHLAYLKDGRKVAVKFLYPGIRDEIAVDMRVLKMVLTVYSRFMPVAKLDRVHESLVDLLDRETNYLHEADCMQKMSKNFEHEPTVVFPEVVTEWTTKDVLTMSFMEGIKITKVEELRQKGVNTDEVAIKLVQAFYKMLFVDRFFHADPHPGNFLVEPGENGSFKLVILDFGAVCKARGELIDGMIEILQGFFSQNDSAVVRGFRKMGFVSGQANDQLLERTVKMYFSRLLKVEDRTAAALMRAKPEQLEKLVNPEMERNDLQELMKSVEYPEDWFYVERACVLMFWLAAQINPSLDTIQIGFPYVMPLLMQKNMVS